MFAFVFFVLFFGNFFCQSKYLVKESKKQQQQQQQKERSMINNLTLEEIFSDYGIVDKKEQFC